MAAVAMAESTGMHNSQLDVCSAKPANSHRVRLSLATVACADAAKLAFAVRTDLLLARSTACTYSTSVCVLQQLECYAATAIALVYTCSCIALGAFSTWYTLLDYRFSWGPVRIGAFATAFGVAIAFTQSVVIRFLVPKYVSERRGIQLGLALQAVSLTAFGLGNRGWQLYATIPLGALNSIAEPCMQALMAASIHPSRQGSLQGAIFSLRVLTGGITAPAYGALFTLGISDKLHRAVEAHLPGLAFLFDISFQDHQHVMLLMFRLLLKYSCTAIAYYHANTATHCHAPTAIVYVHVGACASLIGMAVAFTTLSTVPQLAAAAAAAPGSPDDDEHQKRPSFAMSTRSTDSISAVEKGEARRRGSLREPLLVAAATADSVRRASYTVGEQQHQQQQQYRRVSFTVEQEPLAALTAVASDI
eukprot:13782-Heterococcus_DN1.PRE.3